MESQRHQPPSQRGSGPRERWGESPAHQNKANVITSAGASTKVIGLTGGIACGKSTVSQILKSLGATILDADKMAHELMQPKQALYHLYVAHWGARILTEHATLDRRAIGTIVFGDADERAWLDSAAHPVLEAELQRRLHALRKKRVSVVVLDVPLLFESGWDKYADEIWVASIPEELQVERLMARNKLAEPEARARIAAQMPLAEKRARANVVFDNSGTREALYTQVRDAYFQTKEGFSRCTSNEHNVNESKSETIAGGTPNGNL